MRKPNVDEHPQIAIDDVIAKALGIRPEQLSDDLEYQSVQEWDSLRHVALMLALEDTYGVKIDDAGMLELHSVATIRSYVADLGKDAAKTSHIAPVAAAPAVATPHGHPPLHRGLEGIYFDRSRIANIDGERGVLEYRGYSIHDLAQHATFEQTAYLLIHGELPGAAAASAFVDAIRSARVIPPKVLELMRDLAGVHPMEALRSGVSLLGAYDPESSDLSRDAQVRCGIRLLAQVPMLVAAHHAAREGRELVTPPGDSTFAAHFLHLLYGRAPSAFAAEVINRDLIVHADHSSNASTFALRVVVGCRSSMHAAMTAAIAAFTGSLHGGAAEKVLDLIDDVGGAENAAAYVSNKLARNEPVMGFGHRVYRTEDPRVRHLRDAALQASREQDDMRDFDTVRAVVQAMQPYARHGVEANVDLYAGLAYRKLGLPDDLAVPVFVVGRMAGWLAQALEQYDNNVLIRPLLHYVGPTGRRLDRSGDAP